jgi:hypothetical protein
MQNLKTVYNNLSVQGQWACWIGVILLINTALATLFLPKHISVMAFLIVLFAIAPIMVYHVNCLVKGQCKTWAWIVLFVLLLGQTGTLLGHLFTKDNKFKIH